MNLQLVGELASIGAAFAWAISLALFRYYGRGTPSYILTLVKNLVAGAGFGILLLLFPAPFPSDARIYLSLIASGIIGISISDSCLFAGLSRVGTVLTAASFSLSPALSAWFAYLFLNETLSPIQIAGTGVVMVAIIGLARSSRPARIEGVPPTGEWWPGLFYLLGAQLTNAVGMTVSHYALASTDIFLGTTLRIVPSFLVLLVFILWRHPPREIRALVPRDRSRGLVVASVIGSFLGLVLMSAGLKYTKAGVAAALNSTSPVWAVPVSHFITRERVSARSLACVILAMAGVVLIFV